MTANNREEESHKGQAAHTWVVAGDLLQNALRRIQKRALEDGFLRCYRVLELIGQARLFEMGLDSESVRVDDPKVAAWIEYKRRKRERIFSLTRRAA